MTALSETPRLSLRQLREGDHETLAANHADPELTRFLGGPASPAESWRRHPYPAPSEVRP